MSLFYFVFVPVFSDLHTCEYVCVQIYMCTDLYVYIDFWLETCIHNKKKKSINLFQYESMLPCRKNGVCEQFGCLHHVICTCVHRCTSWGIKKIVNVCDK